jgi:hypothetical protein
LPPRHIKRNDRAPHNVVLAACAGHHDLHQSSELQLFGFKTMDP